MDDSELIIIAVAIAVAQGLFIGLFVGAMINANWLGSFASLVGIATAISAISIIFNAQYDTTFRELIIITSLMTAFAVGVLIAASIGWALMHCMLVPTPTPTLFDDSESTIIDFEPVPRTAPLVVPPRPAAAPPSYASTVPPVRTATQPQIIESPLPIMWYHNDIRSLNRSEVPIIRSEE
jgi:hypothetical protein